MSERDIYPAEDAERFYKRSAGKPYRPSNGTEGDIFYSAWCADCRRENYNHETGDGGCPIFTDTLIYGPEDAEYPKAWRYSDRGQPECTEFEARQ